MSPRTGCPLALAAALGCHSPLAATSAGEATTAASSSGSVTGDMAEGTWAIGHELGVDRGALFGVWGPAPDEVYAVGGQGAGATSVGVMLRWDGSAWSEVALPAETRRLHWIAGVDGALWVVGEDGTALRREGEKWTATATGVETSLWGIWGADAAAVWAVGGSGFNDEAPVLLRWDGSAWAPEVMPALPPECHALFKVWGADANDVTVVGDFGAALHHDGAQWTLQDAGSIADLISVHGRAKERVAVGGRANARVARWDGDAWTGEVLDRPGLSGVWVASDGSATAVGSSGQILHSRAGEPLWVEEDSPTILVLHAVFGFDEGPRFAVGGNITGNPPYIGVVVQHPGACALPLVACGNSS